MVSGHCSHCSHNSPRHSEQLLDQWMTSKQIGYDRKNSPRPWDPDSHEPLGPRLITPVHDKVLGSSFEQQIRSYRSTAMMFHMLFHMTSDAHCQGLLFAHNCSQQLGYANYPWHLMHYYSHSRVSVEWFLSNPTWIKSQQNRASKFLKWLTPSVRILNETASSKLTSN